LWQLENDPVKKSVINLKSRQSDPMTEQSKTRTELHRSGEDD
jgi:hypothetical protein